jgi:hypothetical protein
MVWIPGYVDAVGGGYVLIFGGQTGRTDLNDLWTLRPGDM